MKNKKGSFCRAKAVVIIMSRGSRENERVRKEITEAMFTLLKQKEFSEITVTDIVSTAKVARASYYRNFQTKEAILEEYMESVYKDISAPEFNETIAPSYSRSDLMRRFEHSLTCLLQRKSYILALYDNGFGSLILEAMNRSIEFAAGDMPSSSIERYKLYFITGAAFNVLIRWLKSGATESPHEMAKACVNFIYGDTIAKLV